MHLNISCLQIVTVLCLNSSNTHPSGNNTAQQESQLRHSTDQPNANIQFARTN